jgi:hypothetical protein
MPDIYYPVGFTPVGDNIAADGHVLGIYLIPVEDRFLKGISIDSPANQTVDVRAYAIGGSGGGDGNPVFTDLNVAVTTGMNSVMFDDPLPVVAGRRYGFVMALEDGGHFKSVNNGSVPLTGDFTSVNEYWPVRVLDTDTLPATMTMAVSMNPPWDQALNYYGVGIIYADVPTKVDFVVSRTSDTSAAVSFTMPGDAPDGITIARCAGTHLGNDGDGRAPSNPDYDPSTIPGTIVVAEGLMSSPYFDTGLTPGVYTYWVARTDDA